MLTSSSGHIKDDLCEDAENILQRTDGRKLKL